MELKEILAIAVKAKGSDIHIKTGLPPIVRIDGRLHPIPNAQRLSPDIVGTMAHSIMNDRQRRIFEENSEVDLAYAVPGLGRFRASVYRQRGTIAMVFRAISIAIPSLEGLNLPPIIKKMCQEERGLILVTGTTGSGKSSTLAAMIDQINNTRTCNIITIEDPVEFLHRDNKSIISQREVGSDTPTFAGALKGALRQDPDVILVGEMRDFETIETAMTAAETGHLVMSTLHTMDAAETINRIISVFPPYHQRQVRIQLAGVIKGVISQRLVPRADGKGRVPAVEVMLGTARIRECIDDKDKTKQINDAIAQGSITYGMQTFDQSLMKLFSSKLITYEEALRQSSNPDDFALKVSGISSTSDSSWDGFEEKEAEQAEPEAFEIEKY
ncbi:type IV pilus twitching motility protein PilT [Geobacter sp. SVR]|uniref:type IV pilus twitching motility protein PilT n=1 Tax=Geobacter sp. SVR TaxID=2495594 RepID=UPI00143EF7B4|nr:type IV pilus twitching motility protein PilT [Geobacter sp. SVR]BCS55548.1 twitching motility protein PilT [Geobacter sp. SVR]GCF83551.1 twitching motility protein PilT [Geobacter sp. SVR]